MDLKKAKILIEKINSLHKSMAADADGVAAIEKDLMLSYVRQLYEVYLSNTPTTTKVASKVEIIKSSPKSKPRKKPTRVPKPVELEIEEPEEIQEPIRVAPPKPVRRAPRVIEVPESLTELQETPPPPPPPKPKPKPVPKPQPSPITAIEDEDLAELFETSSSKELSEKLSNLPIRDLKKAMGLNEKIFTINELFGGNADQYNKVIGDLNGMNNFEEAKVYLVQNIAGKFDWAKRGKKKKAKNFIKLVRRRYA